MVNSVEGITQIYIQIIDQLLDYIVTQESAKSYKSLTELDSIISNVFEDDTIPAKAFEDFFRVYDNRDTSPVTAKNGVKSDYRMPTLLHVASRYGLQSLAELLISLPNSEFGSVLVNVDGRSPKDIAMENGHTTVATIVDKKASGCTNTFGRKMNEDENMKARYSQRPAPPVPEYPIGLMPIVCEENEEKSPGCEYMCADPDPLSKASSKPVNNGISGGEYVCMDKKETVKTPRHFPARRYKNHDYEVIDDDDVADDDNDDNYLPMNNVKQKLSKSSSVESPPSELPTTGRYTGDRSASLPNNSLFFPVAGTQPRPPPPAERGPPSTAKKPEPPIPVSRKPPSTTTDIPPPVAPRPIATLPPGSKLTPPGTPQRTPVPDQRGSTDTSAPSNYTPKFAGKSSAEIKAQLNRPVVMVPEPRRTR